MHLLHTTEAFVLGRYPHGESNFTYKLFTKKFGLLYAHGQGVRELKSRNKYALTTGRFSDITLVKGREVWRITGAVPSADIAGADTVAKRKVLHTTGTLLPVEDDTREVFLLLRAFCACSSNDSIEIKIQEALTLFRILNTLGFVARPVEEELMTKFLCTTELEGVILKEALAKESLLINRVNSALQEALQ